MWYEEVRTGEPLRQGQLLPDFRVRQTTYRTVSGLPEVQTLPPGYVIVLTQSCDLFRPERDANGAIIQNVLIAPVVPMSTAHVKNADKYPKSKMTLYHFLPASDEFALPYSIVSFSQTTSVPFEYVDQHARSSRCFRLKSPFLEDLAHRFGDIFSRVALPEPAFDEDHYNRTVQELKRAAVAKTSQA